MKTEVEINGFEITVEDVEGKVQVKVEMNDEVVEELTLDPSEYEGASDDEEELKAFGDEESKEEDEDAESDEHEEAEGETEDEEMMGESIKTFEDMFPTKKG